jgi:hypothetical protein
MVERPRLVARQLFLCLWFRQGRWNAVLWNCNGPVGVTFSTVSLSWHLFLKKMAEESDVYHGDDFEKKCTRRVICITGMIF